MTMLDTVKSRVNGFDLVALSETVEAIEADPAKALVAFDVTTRWTGQTRSETTVDGYVVGAALRGIKLDSLEIKTRGQLDLRGFLGLSDHVAPGYEKIEYEVHIKGDGSPRAFEEIHQTVMRTSPITSTSADQSGLPEPSTSAEPAFLGAPPSLSQLARPGIPQGIWNHETFTDGPRLSRHCRQIGRAGSTARSQSGGLGQ
jgi:hypothetical protein